MLEAFLDGSLDEGQAVAVAVHLDSCPPCRQAAFAADDLHLRVVDAEEDAEPPAELAAEIWAARPVEARPTSRAPVIAMALMAAAGFLLTVLGDPISLVAEGAAWGRGLTMAATAVAGPSGLGSWVAAPAVGVLAGAVLVFASQRSRLR